MVQPAGAVYFPDINLRGDPDSPQNLMLRLRYEDYEDMSSATGEILYRATYSGRNSCRSVDFMKSASDESGATSMPCTASRESSTCSGSGIGTTVGR